MENNTNFTDILEEPPAADPADTGRYVFQLIAHTIVFLLGVPGNCLILRVYWTKTRKTSTHVLIMALAWADLSVCLIGAYRIPMAALSVKGEPVPSFFDLILPFEHTAVGTSVVITAIIAVDRYDCICRPNRRFFTYRRGVMAACAALPISFVVHIPTLISVFVESDSYFIAILPALATGSSFVIFLVIIVTCYVEVYIAIRKHVKIGAVSGHATQVDISVYSKRSTRSAPDTSAKSRSDISIVDKTTPINNQSMNSSIRANTGGLHEKISDASTSGSVMPGLPQAKVAMQESDNSGPHNGNEEGHAPKKSGAGILQRRTTRMLFITSMVFILSWLPYWIWMILRFADNGRGRFTNLYLAFYAVQIILFLNNAVNPLIYGLANRRFRKDCKEVLTKIKLC